MTVALMSWKNRLSKQLFGQYGTTRTLTDKRKPHHVSQHRPVRVTEGLHHPWGSAFLDLGEEHFARRHELFVGERDSGSGCCGCRCAVAVEEDVIQHSRDLFDGPAFAAFMKSTRFPETLPEKELFVSIVLPLCCSFWGPHSGNNGQF